MGSYISAPPSYSSPFGNRSRQQSSAGSNHYEMKPYSPSAESASSCYTNSKYAYVGFYSIFVPRIRSSNNDNDQLWRWNKTKFRNVLFNDKGMKNDKIIYLIYYLMHSWLVILLLGLEHKNNVWCWIIIKETLYFKI